MKIAKSIPKLKWDLTPNELFELLKEEYGISDSGGISILKAGICAFSRAEAARAQIDKDGLMIQGKDGTWLKHPLLAVERDCRAQWLQALKQLNLDVEPSKPIGRPPAPYPSGHHR